LTGRPRLAFHRAARRGPNSQPGRLRYVWECAARFDFDSPQVFSFASARDKSRVRISVNKVLRRSAPISLGQWIIVSITIQLDLPDALVKEAREAGLLESGRLADWLTDELRRKRAREEFGQMLKKLHSVDDEPMPMEEIQAEVDAVREERRRREGGR
jgi:hypothetical protein